MYGAWERHGTICSDLVSGVSSPLEYVTPVGFEEVYIAREVFCQDVNKKIKVCARRRIDRMLSIWGLVKSVISVHCSRTSAAVFMVSVRDAEGHPGIRGCLNWSTAP